MSDPAWLDELRMQLMRLKLPPAYAARLVDELSDHVTDFMEDQMSTDALQTRGLVKRLGAPLDVARQAQQEFKRRTFSGRHPLLVFVVLPLFVLTAGYVASLLSVIGIGHVVKALNPGLSSDAMSPTGVGLMRLACMGLLMLPAVLTAALFGWLAGKSGVARRWPTIACVLVGIMAGAAQMDMYVSPATGKSSLTMGLGFGTGTAIYQIAKLAIPLAIGLLVFSRQTRAQQGALTA